MDEQNNKKQAEQVVEKIKELVKSGSASHVTLKRKGETVFSVSLNAGLLGAAIGLKAAPFALLTAALISFGLDCEIEIEKKDGTIINLNETKVGSKLENLKNAAKGKAKDIFGDGFDVAVSVDPDEDDAAADAEVIAETDGEETP